jgi:hypothetical protein
MNNQFIYISGTFSSFASYNDVRLRDSRVFEANEDITEAEVSTYLQQASQRILTQIKNTDWWADYQRLQANLVDPRLLPAVNPDNIMAATQEFKDLNVYFALQEYIYPTIADFGNPDSAEVAKIKFYKDAYNLLFQEVIQSGSWYDFSADGQVDTADKMPVQVNRVRTR